ncbi:MAG: hypothetical protein WDW38_007552 [Sanguina aurantia]
MCTVRALANTNTTTPGIGNSSRAGLSIARSTERKRTMPPVEPTAARAPGAAVMHGQQHSTSLVCHPSRPVGSGGAACEHAPVLPAPSASGTAVLCPSTSGSQGVADGDHLGDNVGLVDQSSQALTLPGGPSPARPGKPPAGGDRLVQQSNTCCSGYFSPGMIAVPATGSAKTDVPSTLSRCCKVVLPLSPPLPAAAAQELHDTVGGRRALLIQGRG